MRKRSLFFGEISEFQLNMDFFYTFLTKMENKLEIKIKPDDQESEEKLKKTGNAKDRQIEISELELAKLKKEWAESVFGDKTQLEIIENEAEAIEKDYEYSENELNEIGIVTEKMGNNLRILEKAIKQGDSEDIRESALKIIRDLAKIAQRSNHDVYGALNKLALRNRDALIEVLEKDLPSRKYAKNFLSGMVRINPDSTDKILPALEKHIDVVANRYELDATDIKIIDWLCSNGDKTDTKYLKLLFHYFVKKPDDYEVILACIRAENEIIKGMGLLQISRMLKEYEFGDDLDIMIQKWQFGGGSESYIPMAFAKNIETIKSIEDKRPGITKFLISKFGIYNFGRYPESLLIKQYDEYENQDLPYGIVIFAEDDHNASYFENKDELKEMSNDLEGKYAIRIMEAGGKKDLLRLFTRLRLKYGQNHKISFAILGAHGDKNEIVLGNVDNIGDRGIYIRNVIKYGKRKYKLFEDDATLIIAACKTGQKEGIASKISEIMDITTIAPKSEAGLESIKPITNNKGGLRFKVKYSHHVRAATFRPRNQEKKEFI